VETKEVSGVDDGRAGIFGGAVDGEVTLCAKGDAMEDEVENAIPVEVNGADALSPVALLCCGKALGFPWLPIPAPPNNAIPVD
jgi:hypothetical protein